MTHLCGGELGLGVFGNFWIGHNSITVEPTSSTVVEGGAAVVLSRGEWAGRRSICRGLLLGLLLLLLLVVTGWVVRLLELLPPPAANGGCMAVGPKVIKQQQQQNGRLSQGDLGRSWVEVLLPKLKLGVRCFDVVH